jgi:mono/diheme cytochrome c family protein
VLTAIDINSGKIAWRKPLPYAGEGGVLVTASGIAFTTDLRGRLYAYDAHNGNELWHDDIGSTVVAPLSAYRINGAPYLVTIGGEGGNQQTPNLPKSQGSRVVAYALNVQQTAMNDAGNQPTPPPLPTGKTESGQTTGTTGTLPYTPQQVQTGKALYKQYCSSCHGANLQGVSAPALTGAPMARAKLNASQMRTVVTTQMPLNAPGSLKPDQYASIMAFLAAYDCIAPSGGGKTPFPTTDQPQFKQVQIGGATCPK